MAPGETAGGAIDRHALISRHDPVYSQSNREAPLTVGNGKFAFTVDPTGLQTFAEAYDKGVPLSTMAEWGWHSWPNPNGYGLEDVTRGFESHGRIVPYPYDPIIDPMSRRGPEYRNFGTEAAKWLYENPHRIGLGREGLVLTKEDGTRAGLGDLDGINQHLEL